MFLIYVYIIHMFTYSSCVYIQAMCFYLKKTCFGSTVYRVPQLGYLGVTLMCSIQFNLNTNTPQINCK